jgi:hypothetical protein
MQLLRQDEIADYCGGTPDEHQTLIEALDEQDRPCIILPILELCAQIHAQARRGRFSVPQFHECWERLVGLHYIYSYSGNGEPLILLADSDPEETNLARLVRGIPPLRMEGPSRRNSRDAEQESNEHKQDVLQDRLRTLQDQMLPAHHPWLRPSSLAHDAPPPDQLPELVAPTETGDLVLDTNVFVLLLMEIMEVRSGRPVPRSIFSRLSDDFYERAIAPLSGPYGAAGKLIVPLSVLVEAEGVVRAKPTQHGRARVALDDLAFNGERGVWNAFEFQRPDLDLLVAFLDMGESFMSTGLLEADWPFLGDMLVLAHGIANACPIASFEWVDKSEWTRTGIVSRYPFLLLR